MSTQIVVLEEVSLTAPFGVRFWDVSTSTPAGGGLRVSAYPPPYRELSIAATESPSGAYSFSGLPGLRAAENGAGDDAYWSANPPAFPFIIEVRDPQQRYLAYSFTTLLPVRGLFALWSSPLFTALTPDPSWLPLFSTPARSLPGPSGLVRTQLKARSGEFAAWAIVQLQASGLPARTGVADENGIVVIYQPYPEPTGISLSSPFTSAKLTNQNWAIDVAVLYTPSKPSQPLPDLDQILQQSQAVAWKDNAFTQPVDQFNLQFEQELVLQSLDSSSGRKLPVLLITAAGSPL